MTKAALFLTVVACVGLVSVGTGSGGTTSTRAVTGTITFDGVWTGQEAQHVQAVINAFQKQSNIYLRQAGAAKYAQLSAHTIKWTAPSVATALKTMRQVIGDSNNLTGGTSGALLTDFPTSVNNVFQNPPTGGMVFEGDFVPGVARVKATPVTDYNEFPFPSINGSGSAVEIGGDTIVTFRDTPAIQAFVKFLATPQAASAWAKLGGFATGNRKMSPSVYPDAITRKTASAISQAKSVVFDVSDEQPSAFGATVGQGEWGLFQSFLRNPSNVSGIQKQLEAWAAAAYSNGG
jgi:alpha-glucoside transport system substrate-binding protein